MKNEAKHSDMIDIMSQMQDNNTHASNAHPPNLNLYLEYAYIL